MKYRDNDDLKEPSPDDKGQAIGSGDSEYVIGKQIGYGAYGVVKEASSVVDGDIVVQAVEIVRKVISSKNLDENEKVQSAFSHETEIWRLLQHPNILRLSSVYETDYATLCIMPLVGGGTLLDLVRTARLIEDMRLDGF